MQADQRIGEPARARVAPGLVLMGLAITLAACSSGPVHDDAVARAALMGLAPDDPAPSPQVLPAIAVGPSAVGMASWYRRGPSLQRTCTGEPLLDDRLSAASPVLPMGTKVRVTLLNGDRSVIVRVNDCMPRGRRLIDLSVAAARELGLLQCGVAMVRVTPVAWR